MLLGAPRFLDFVYKSKTNEFFFFTCVGPMINHVNMIKKNYKQRVTYEKNYVCATVTIDTDFDRQIHNNNNNNNNDMRAVKLVVYR